jgi:hypothetical protein
MGTDSREQGRKIKKREKNRREGGKAGKAKKKLGRRDAGTKKMKER